MSGIIRRFAIVLLLSTASVIAQVAKPAEPHTASQAVDFWVTKTEQLLVPAAEAPQPMGWSQWACTAFRCKRETTKVFF